MERLAGPVYGTWDEAMNDPGLDLSKPWFVAPDAPLPPNVLRVPAVQSQREWPSGWTEMGATAAD